MNRVVFILLLFFCAAASAEVYRHTTPDGRVTFSDRPAPDAEEVYVPPLQTYDAVPVPKRTKAPKAKKEKTFDYSELAILSPSDGEAIRANDGSVEVKLAVTPSLRPGHAIVLSLDGERNKSGSKTKLQLNNLSRGSHTLKAQVVDEKGQSLHQSVPIKFYLLRVVGG